MTDVNEILRMAHAELDKLVDARDAAEAQRDALLAALEGTLEIVDTYISYIEAAIPDVSTTEVKRIQAQARDAIASKL